MSTDEQLFVVAFFATLVVIPALALLAGWWGTFRKAGIPGWIALVPIYNVLRLCQVGGKSRIWALLLLVPGVNIFALLEVTTGVSKRFGKGALFPIGLALLSFVYWPILGFDGSTYNGPKLT